MAFDDVGRIVVAGVASPTVGGSSHLMILRYLANGRLDTSFGTSGFVIDQAPGQAAMESIAIDRAGRIIVGGLGWEPLGMMVARYLPDGTRDSSFGTDGVARLTPVASETSFSRAYSLALDGRGRIVVATTTQETVTRAHVGRFLPSGQLDLGFGSAGHVVTAFPRGDGIALTGVAVDSRDRVLACGYIGDGSGSPESDQRLVVVRYLENGRLDTSFSGDGFAVSDLSHSLARTMAVRGDRVTVGGAWFR